MILSGYLLFFWTLAGQTPGMRLLGIRLIDAGGARAQSRDRDPPPRMDGARPDPVRSRVPGRAGVRPPPRLAGLEVNTEVILVDRDGRPESASRARDRASAPPSIDVA